MRRPFQRTTLALPPKGSLPKPDQDDPLDYYYRPFSAGLYRARLRLALRLLGEERRRSLLEVGYGSGILLPELARRAERVAAIDVHGQREAVAGALERLGVAVELRQASLFELPFADGEFSALVCLSVLEHLTELDAAFVELARVLEPGAVAVIGFPVRNAATDRLFALLGYDAREIHPASDRDIVAAAERSPGFDLERCARIPPLAPRPLAAYVACRLRAR